LQRRNFQTWEGGEGQVIAQHARTHLALGRAALARGDAGAARALFAAALETPENLGEARHPFANQSDLRYWLGCAREALGEREGARREWRRAASYTGDFQEMSVQAFSELTYFCGLAWLRLGQPRKARTLFRGLLAHARQLARDSGDIGFFVTSLPTDVLRDDVAARRRTTALLLEAQARLGLGEKARARALLRTVLRRDPGHAAARDLAAGLAQT
jgi:tetratricopeptide (TPR) repeat protein